MCCCCVLRSIALSALLYKAPLLSTSIALLYKATLLSTSIALPLPLLGALPLLVIITPPLLLLLL